VVVVVIAIDIVVDAGGSTASLDSVTGITVGPKALLDR
jgi:hypothetical protein